MTTRPGVSRETFSGDVDVRAGHKVLVMGMNGTGKSRWAQAIATSWERGSIVVFDSKGDDPAALVPNCTIATRAADVVRRLPGRVVYRPASSEQQGRRVDGLRPLWARWDLICRRVWENAQRTREPSLVVVHELAELCTAQSIGPAFQRLITAGRSWGVTPVLVTQRPQHTTLWARSEAQHVVAFALPDRAAREVAASLMDDIFDPKKANFVLQRSLPLDHTWWYRGPDFRLALHAPIAIGG